jgi:bifunctional enzyme CysN/CysC
MAPIAERHRGWRSTRQVPAALHHLRLSVDDGKSTLIGRLLYDSKHDLRGPARRARATASASARRARDRLRAAGRRPAAEREQGITIDVAYRFFATEKRKFIVADTPGHEQYTRNMVTGASTADLAVILVDARKGVLTQTRRHSYLAHLLGIRHLVLAVNKMDLVGYDQGAVRRDRRRLPRLRRAKIGHRRLHAIPVSGLTGDKSPSAARRDALV